MATLHDLASDPDWTPDAINVLAPSLAARSRWRAGWPPCRKCRESSRCNSFVPEHQEEKLALIGDAAADASIPSSMSRPVAPPSDAELQQSLAATAASLRQAAARRDGLRAAGSARRLADVLDRLQPAAPDVRAAAAAAVVAAARRHARAGSRAAAGRAGDARDACRASSSPTGSPRTAAPACRSCRSDDRDDNASLRRFARAVQAVAPDATGMPISIRASGDSVVDGLPAGRDCTPSLAITLLLAVVLRRVRDVVLTMLPVLLSGLLTFATCAALDLPLNFANIIALPLLFGVGVAFNIYFVMAWRAGETAMLQSSLMRAVVFSALTTATAFGALWLSSHPGTASMGRLLMISLGWELLVTLLFRPALLASPPAREG